MMTRVTNLRTDNSEFKRAPNPKETVKLIERLVSLQLLDETSFRLMHHRGDSIAGFSRYCQTVKTFIRDGANYKLHEELAKMLDGH